MQRVGTSVEQVVLLDEDGTVIGAADKATIHSPHTPLHLAFSCHVANAAGELLVTRRALDKATWPGVWTNAFCGHPAPGEAMSDAVVRRARQELGIELLDLAVALPDFRYRAVDASGIVEYEICPVHSAWTTDEVTVDPAEVVEYRWVAPDALAAAARLTPWAFSPWLTLQLAELDASAVTAP